MKKSDLHNICKYEGIPLGGKKVDLAQKMMLHVKNLDECSENASKGVYTPSKYFEGLSPKQAEKRLKEIRARAKDSDSTNYKPFTTDFENGKRVPTKQSPYVSAFIEKFGSISSLEDKALASGIPLDVLERVWNKGMAAWRGGHRPGASQKQWASARVASFIMKGCTFYFPDHLLVAEAMERSKEAKKHWDSITCMCQKGCSPGKK